MNEEEVRSQCTHSYSRDLQSSTLVLLGEAGPRLSTALAEGTEKRYCAQALAVSQGLVPQWDEYFECDFALLQLN